MAFDAPIDIINRALQLVGSSRRALTDNQKNVTEGVFAYDKIRLAALRRNLWTFATRRVVLRAVGVDTLVWTPPTWSATTWTAGQVASYTPTSGPYIGDTLYWQTDAAKTSSNTTTPDNDANWHRYFGPVAVDLYDSGHTYQSGEIVIVPAAWSGATTYAKNAVVRSSTTWYVSLADTNLNHAVTDTTWWAAWASNGRSATGWGETSTGVLVPLTYPGTPSFYMSLISSNGDNPLTSGSQWLSLTGTGAALLIVYPLGTGPLTQLATSNIFRLPFGYLRDAPGDPKANVSPFLGYPRGQYMRDWVREGDYIVSPEVGPIMVRFIADIVDVPDMDPMFCEGLACQIALDSLVQSLTQAPDKRQELEQSFRRLMVEARNSNAIEMGPVDAPIDSYITVRW